METIGPLSIKGALKSSLILLDSTPLPKEKQLYQSKVFIWPCTWLSARTTDFVVVTSPLVVTVKL